jgi:hypothetical protein
MASYAIPSARFALRRASDGAEMSINVLMKTGKSDTQPHDFGQDNQRGV